MYIFVLEDQETGLMGLFLERNLHLISYTENELVPLYCANLLQGSLAIIDVLWFMVVHKYH